MTDTEDDRPYENLYGFLAGQFADADLAGWSDEEAACASLAPDTATWHRRVLAEGRAALAAPSFPWHAVADHANRVLDTEEDARAWLSRMLDVLEREIERGWEP